MQNNPREYKTTHHKNSSGWSTVDPVNKNKDQMNRDPPGILKTKHILVSLPH